MPGPSTNFNTVEVRGTYVNIDGNPPQGQVIFKPTAPRLVDSAATTLILGNPLTVELVNGAFTVQLPATDDPDISPASFTYTVTEKFQGGSTYQISVPIAALATGIDISDIVVP